MYMEVCGMTPVWVVFATFKGCKNSSDLSITDEVCSYSAISEPRLLPSSGPENLHLYASLTNISLILMFEVL
jgi:hypothetical protein